MANGIPVVELKNAGDSIALEVSACGELPFGRYKEIEFVGKDPNGRMAAVRVPKQSADRQLARFEPPLSYATAIGKRITIKRDENKSEPHKPFWGLYLENGNGAAPKAAAAMTTSGEHAQPNGNGTVSVERREKLSASYQQVTAFVIDKIVPMYNDKLKVPVTAGDVAQMVDSLFRGVTHT